MPSGSFDEVDGLEILPHIVERRFRLVQLSGVRVGQPGGPVPPRVLLRLVVHRDRLAFEDLVPLLEAHDRLDHREVALAPGAGLVVAVAIAGVLLERQQVLRPLHRVLVAAAKIERLHEEVHVVAVMAGRIERVRGNPLLLDGSGRRERRDGGVDPIALRVDVSRHVRGVRDVGDETGVARVVVPRVLRRLAAFPRMNQIVMRAKRGVVFLDDLLEQRDRFHRVLARVLGDGIEAVVEREAEHRFRLEIVRIRGHELAEAGDVGGIGRILRARCAARGHRFDVETLARRHRVAQRHRLADRFTRPNLRIESGTARRTGHGVRRRAGAAPVPRPVLEVPGLRSNWNAGR